LTVGRYTALPSPLRPASATIHPGRIDEGQRHEDARAQEVGRDHQLPARQSVE
jgi:hypothetical protein